MSDTENVIAGARQEGAHPFTILVVDDEPAILESIELTLGDDYRVLTALSARAALDVLEREEVSLVIADQVMPQMNGAELLERAVAIQPRAVRMMLTGYADVNAIVRAINAGKIYRYIQKPWEPDQLRLDVKTALEAYRLTAENAQLAGALAIANEKLRAENLYLRQQVQRAAAFDQLVGNSGAMQRVFDVMQKVAQTDATVLVTGETGTGKDLVARAIHYAGARKERRFVAQNCGALPDTLLESELFGHKRGAFTGAHADKKGLFEIADGGTIFLDEIGETEPGMQVRLLRVLQDGEIRPLGSSDVKRVDVRIIAATNRDLKKLVEQGRFREDLLYRLRVVEIRIPALRERREDVPALAHHFLDRANAKMRRALEGFSNAAMDRLCAHQWNGNVRELENEIQRAVALAGDEKLIGAEMLSEHVRGPAPAQAAKGVALPAETNLNRALEALQAAMIQDALKAAGNITRAAERLGIPRQSLQKMVKRLGLREEPKDE